MKKMSPQEVAEAFSSLSAEEKKFFQLHVERIGNQPSNEDQPKASDESPLEETTKRGIFGGKKKKEE